MTQIPQGCGSACLHFTFEAAHRQPEVGGKCRNLHGHSWRLDLTLYNNSVVGGVNLNTGLSVEFSQVKRIIRTWLDVYLDHATLLGVKDILALPLIEDDCKLFLFGGDVVQGQHSAYEVADDRHYDSLPWPSVEAVAHCLGERLQEELTNNLGSYVTIESLQLSETDANSYMWFASVARDTGIPYERAPADKGLGMDFR